MNKPAKWMVALLTSLVVLVVLAVVYVVYLFDWNRVRDPLADFASTRADRKIAITGDIDVRWGWPLTGITIGGIEVGNVQKGSARQLLALKSLHLSLDLKSLLMGDLRLRTLQLEAPQVFLEKFADGSNNWKFGANPAGAVALAPLPDERSEFPIVDDVNIDDGTLSFTNHETGMEVEVHAARVQGAAKADQARTRFDGSGIVRGQKFRFTLVGGSVTALRNSSEPYPVSAELVAGKTHAAIDGVISDPIAMKGLDLTMRVGGDNAADLFPLTGIALLPTPPYEVTGKLGYRERVWRFNDFTGRMGASDLSGDLRWDMRHARPKLIAQFTSKRLALVDLKGFIGARTRGESSEDRLIPDVPLDISRLNAMDADVDFRGVQVVAEKAPVDNFHAHFVLTDRVLKVAPIRFGSGTGDVAMDLTIDARAQPMRIASHTEVRRLSVAHALKSASARLGEANLTEGFLGGTGDLKGSGASLREMLASANGQIGLGMQGGQLSQVMVELMGLDIAESLGYLMAGDRPVPIRCLIADFKVEDGDMQARSLVFDTADTVVRGQGRIDLKTEKLDLELKPAPKDFSPLVIRAPLELRGTLKHPHPEVSKKSLIKRGAMAALLAMLMPPAALLAFIEPGLGENSQCSGLLAAMSEHSPDPANSRALVPKTPTTAKPSSP